MLARSLKRGPLAVALGVTLAVSIPGLAAEQTIQPKQVPRVEIVRPQGEQAQDPQQGLMRATPGRAMKLDKATLGKLETLPKDQILDVAGKQMTAGEYKVKLREHQKQAADKAKSIRGGAALSSDALQAELDKTEATRINAANTKVMSEMAKIKVAPAASSPAPARATPNAAQANAIRREAAEIQTRAQDGNATPQDEARAQELLNQFQQLK